MSQSLSLSKVTFFCLTEFLPFDWLKTWVAIIKNTVFENVYYVWMLFCLNLTLLVQKDLHPLQCLKLQSADRFIKKRLLRATQMACNQGPSTTRWTCGTNGSIDKKTRQKISFSLNLIRNGKSYKFRMLNKDQNDL